MELPLCLRVSSRTRRVVNLDFRYGLMAGVFRVVVQSSCIYV